MISCGISIRKDLRRSYYPHCSDSDNGGKAAAIVYSMMPSAKANQVEPFAYVRDRLVQLSRHSPPAVAALLPNTWLAGHPESRRCWSR
jgi:hypothetical protein